MPETSPQRMTVDEFLVWAEGRQERYELVDGRRYVMSPERVQHARTKGRVFVSLRDAISKASLSCESLPDGLTIRIDRTTAFEPDASVRCGPPLDGGELEVSNAVVVVEVLSPSTRNYDAGAKLAGYFSVSTIHHYLMIDPDRRVVIHHGRDGDAIRTTILGSGPLRLDPPGLDLDVADLLGPES